MRPVGRLTCVTMCLGAVALWHYGSWDRAYPDPQRFEASVKAFEESVQKHPRTPGNVLCIGSSSIAGWYATIQRDLAPLPVTARGFADCNLNDVLHYVDRLVVPQRPRAIILYAGENDIVQGISPAGVRDTFRAFVAAVQARQPETPIYLISIKPSPARWALWPKMAEANGLLRAVCEKDPKRLVFVDVAERMLENGSVRANLFGEDRLHMSHEGYVIWREAVRDAMLQGGLFARGT